MSDNISAILYLISGVLFILALRGLSLIFVSLHGFTVETLKEKFYLSRHGCVEVIIYFENNTDATSIIALSSVKTSTV